jgi:hypothetical protein
MNLSGSAINMMMSNARAQNAPLISPSLVMQAPSVAGQSATKPNAIKDLQTTIRFSGNSWSVMRGSYPQPARAATKKIQALLDQSRNGGAPVIATVDGYEEGAPGADTKVFVITKLSISGMADAMRPGVANLTSAAARQALDKLQVHSVDAQRLGLKIADLGQALQNRDAAFDGRSVVRSAGLPAAVVQSAVKQNTVKDLRTTMRFSGNSWSVMRGSYPQPARAATKQIQDLLDQSRNGGALVIATVDGYEEGAPGADTKVFVITKLSISGMQG